MNRFATHNLSQRQVDIHKNYLRLEFDMLLQSKVVDIEVEVLEYFSVMHEVSVVLWNGEVAVAHHFLAAVDDG